MTFVSLTHKYTLSKINFGSQSKTVYRKKLEKYKYLEYYLNFKKSEANRLLGLSRHGGEDYNKVYVKDIQCERVDVNMVIGLRVPQEASF